MKQGCEQPEICQLKSGKKKKKGKISEIGDACISHRLSPDDFVSFAKRRSKFSGGLIESTRRLLPQTGNRQSDFPWHLSVQRSQKQFSVADVRVARRKQRKTKPRERERERERRPPKANCFFIERTNELLGPSRTPIRVSIYKSLARRLDCLTGSNDRSIERAGRHSLVDSRAAAR